MPFESSAYVETGTPARYISRLCKHFAHKVPVAFDEQQGRIEFEKGLGLLQADDKGLRLTVQTDNQDDLPYLQDVLGRHFERVAWQAELTLNWQ
jgi:hypothetical protein